MKCPFCDNKDTKVLDSRNQQSGSTVRRRRRCPKCDRRFTTYEKIELTMPVVLKNDGRREAFNKEKLYSGIEKACQKRPVSPEQIEQLLNSIEKFITEKNVKEVTTQEVGKQVMLGLRGLDPVAYVRFASVYSHFHDIEEFVRKLQDNEKRNTIFFQGTL